MSNTLTTKGQALAAKATAAVHAEEGQGALEYIAIAIGLITVIYAGFRIVGVNIYTEAENLVKNVLSGTKPT